MPCQTKKKEITSKDEVRFLIQSSRDSSLNGPYRLNSIVTATDPGFIDLNAWRGTWPNSLAP